MASIINATTTAGVSVQGDNSGSLQLATNNGTTAVTIDTSQRVAFVAGTAALPSITTTGDTNTGIFFPAADTMAFAEGGTEVMRIDSSGNVLIGTTSSLGGGARLNVSYVYTNDGARWKSDSTAVHNAIVFANPNGDVGTIQTSGSATSYNTSSDYRLKENIVPMVGALDKVAALKPVTYKWKIDGTNGQGFIAHELQAVVPDCVTGEKDAVETYTDEDGNEQTRIKPQGVDTSFLVATLTAAIQELKAELDATKAEVQALKGTL